MSGDEWTNVCEHGDHPAPEGKRFCCTACARCEVESKNEETGCDGICLAGDQPAPDVELTQNAFRGALLEIAALRARLAAQDALLRQAEAVLVAASVAVYPVNDRGNAASMARTATIAAIRAAREANR